MSLKTTYSDKIVPQEIIQSKIFLIRSKKVMIDKDLAGLYRVQTKYLKRAAKKNTFRFPADFMSELTKQENNSLKHHFGTLKRGGHSRYLPHAFTDYGILMLSSVRNSKRAIQVNIQIMKIFIKLQEMLASHQGLRQKIEEMEGKYDSQFRAVFKAIKKLLMQPQRPKAPIGFRPR